jgi:hypothetical protein
MTKWTVFVNAEIPIEVEAKTDTEAVELATKQQEGDCFRIAVNGINWTYRNNDGHKPRTVSYYSKLEKQLSPSMKRAASVKSEDDIVMDHF